MQPLSWVEKADEHESLAVCLRAVLGGRGNGFRYEQLLATLGLGNALVVDDSDQPACWPAAGRDLALLPTAAAYGLTLRPLHRPSAATGLGASLEFSLHFRDSYVPLIQRALDSAQPCLAWCGWPESAGREWGVLTEYDGASLVGFAPGFGGDRIELVAPAHLVYVVEDSEGSDGEMPDARGLFGLARDHALCFWQGRAAAERGLRSGSTAYDRWVELIMVEEAAAEAAGAHAALTRKLTSARRHQAAWLRRLAVELGGTLQRLALAWAETCERVASRLAFCGDEATMAGLLARRSGRVEVRAILEECRAAETVLMADLAHRH